MDAVAVGVWVLVGLGLAVLAAVALFELQLWRRDRRGRREADEAWARFHRERAERNGQPHSDPPAPVEADSDDYR